MKSGGSQSQNERILAILQSGRSLTPLEALREVGSLRLRARVHNLKAMGYDIQTRMVERDGKHFAEYFLPLPKGQLSLPMFQSCEAAL
jgi:hypothetical protein